METIQVTGIPYESSGPYDLELTDPELFFDWEATTLDIRAQISKRLLIITPHVGMGVTIASTSVATGFRATPQVVGGSAPSVAELAQANGLTLDQDGFSVRGQTTDMVRRRLFGGISLNLLILKLDGSVMLDLDTDAVGATIGARIQL